MQSFLSDYQQNSGKVNKSFSVKIPNKSKLNNSYSASSIPIIRGPVKKSFYHHSNIFSLNHYKNLTEHIIDGTDPDIIKNRQKSILIRQFRYKVEQYLLFSKFRKEQATKEFNQYYSKAQDSLFKTEGYEVNRSSIKGSRSSVPNVGLSFLSTNNDENSLNLSIIQPELDKSLLNIDSNKFNYAKLSKQQASLINNMSVDIYFEDQFGKKKEVTHKFNHKKLQDYIFNKIKYILSTDTEYDKKIEFFTQEYERILQKIQNQSYKVKVPYNYSPQMQQFNEYYSIDLSRIKNTQQDMSQSQIDDNLMNQILDDANFSDEEIEEEDNYQDEESEYEEEEIQEIIQPEQDQSNEEKKKVDQMNLKQFDNQLSKQQEQMKEEAQKVIGLNMKQTIKIVKKKKKKITDQNQDEQNNDQTLKENNGQKVSRKQRNRDNQKGNQSAMDEYLIQRPPSQRREKKPKPLKQQQPQTIQKPVVPNKVKQPMVGTPQQQNNRQQVIIPPLRTNQQQVSKQKVQSSSTESPRQQNTSSVKSQSDSNRGEEKVVIQKNIISKQSLNQQNQDINQVEIINEGIESQQQSNFEIEEDLRDRNNTNDIISQEFEEDNQNELKPHINKMNSLQQQQQQQQPQEESEKEDTYKKQQTLQNSKSIKSQPNKEVENQEEEYEEYEEVQIETEIPQQDNNTKKIVEQDLVSEQDVPNKEEKGSTIPSNTPKIQIKNKQNPRKQNDNTQNQVQDKSIHNSPKGSSTPQAEVANTPSQRQESGFNPFIKNDVKKRVGTGLLDELTKPNNLLDFNTSEFKKVRKLPNLPQGLEFRQNEDKILFDAMFKWQYEVDMDIEEMESKLNKKSTNKYQNDSDDDDDDRDSYGKKSSVHSSDITDFGQPAPDKNSLQNISSEEFSDIE